MNIERLRFALSAAHKKGFFHLLSANFLTQFLGFGSILLVAKFLSADELGSIKILQSYTALFVVIGGFGANSAILKLCSEKRPEGEKLAFLRHAIIRSSLTTGAAVLLMAVLCKVGVIGTPSLSRWVLVYSLTIPFLVLTDILTVYLQAVKKITAMARAQSLIKLQSVLLVIVGTKFWGLSGFVLATVVAYAAGIRPALRQVGLQFLRAPQVALPKSFGQVAQISVITNGLGVLSQYADIFILNHFSSDRIGIGYYSLATIFLLGAMQVTNTAQSIATPYFSEKSHDLAWFKHQLLKNQATLTVLSIGVAILVYIAAWILIPLVYGPSYSPTLSYLLVLLLKYIVASSYSIIGVALFGMGLVKFNLLAVALATPVGFALSYLLLGRMGMIGVAWAQVGSALLVLGLELVMIRIAINPRRSYIK